LRLQLSRRLRLKAESSSGFKFSGLNSSRKEEVLEEIYDLELERVLREIEKLKAKRVLLQLPDGLKVYGERLAEEFSRRLGVEAYVSGSSCYGGCDLALKEAEALKADLLIHYGHTPFLEETGGIKVLYVEARCRLEILSVVEKALPLLGKYERIGLTASLQHVHGLREAAGRLEAEGKTAVVGDGKGRGVAYPGQVLGCNASAAENISDFVEAFLHVGGGTFHPLGVYLATGKPVVHADPFTMEVSEISPLGEEVKRRVRGSIGRLLEASKIGVILCSKPGQFQPGQALNVKRELERVGKKPVLLVLEEISEEALGNFPGLEGFVSTACPRVGVDDAGRFSRPLVPADLFFKALRGGLWD